MLDVNQSYVLILGIVEKMNSCASCLIYLLGFTKLRSSLGVLLLTNSVPSIFQIHHVKNDDPVQMS